MSRQLAANANRLVVMSNGIASKKADARLPVSEITMAKFGFKEINQQNWLEPDQAIKGFVTISPAGMPLSMSGEDWMRAILAPKLLEAVPQDVQALFEVARGALVYGYSFIRFIPWLPSSCLGSLKRPFPTSAKPWEHRTRKRNLWRKLDG